MPIVTVAGSSYTVPTEGSENWATDVSNLLVKLATSTSVLQNTSSNFPLAQDLSFGTNYGLKVQYLKSQAANPASSGILRLGNTESIKWRNAANNADLDLTVNASNALQFNGSSFAISGSIVNDDVNASAAIAYSKLNLATSIVNTDISNSAAIAYSKLNLSTSILNADISASAAIAYSKLNLATSIVNADISASAAIAYSKLNIANNDLTIAKTSGLQTALDGKVDESTLTTKGDIYVATASATIARQGIGSDGQILVADSSQTNGLKWSTISGGVNYILNPGAEASTTGWAAYADAAATRPVNGIDGSPSSTWTRSTSSPLVGSGSFLWTKSAANRQGEGVSYDFTIDVSQKAKVLQIEFSYLVSSGTFVAGSSSADSDMIVYIYDVTNGALIEPSSIKLLSNSTTIADKFVANFQTASNSVSYRLIIHTATTSASAYTLQFDDFKVAPCNYVYGTPITDWASYSPILKGGTNGLTFSNQTSTGRYRRVGDSIEIDIYTTFTGTPATGTGNFNWTFPSGVVADTSKVSSTGINQLVGNASYTDSGTNFRVDSIPYINTSTTIEINHDGAAASAFNLTVPITWTTNDNIKFRASFPVVGYSASVQQSDGFDSRAIGSLITFAGTQNLTSGADTKITLDTVSNDTASMFVLASNHLVIKTSGYYDISGAVGYGGNSTNSRTAKIMKNVSTTLAQVVAQAVAGGNGTVVPVSINNVYLVAGDTLQLNALQDSGSTLGVLNSSQFTYLSINKSQAPATISATEKVTFMAEGASSSAAGSAVVIPFNTPTEDSHGGWNSTTKEYTVPVSGTYKVTCASRLTFSGATVNQYMNTLIQVDSGNKREFVKYLENTGIAGLSGIVSYQGPLVAGQKIRGMSDTNLASPVLTTGATHTYLEIFRIK